MYAFPSPSKLDPNSPAMEKLKKSKVFNPSRSSVLLVLQESTYKFFFRYEQRTYERLHLCVNFPILPFVIISKKVKST